MEKKNISVKLNNNTYILQTMADEKKVQDVVSIVDGKMRALSENNHLRDAEMIAVWTALDLAGELVELKQRYAELLEAATEA